MTILDIPVRLDPDHARDLLHLLETLDGILRYASHDTLDDIAGRYHAHMTSGLLHALQLHSSLLRHAITTSKGLSTHHDY